ncbi:MAG: alpha/beta fold hydrolase [Desulfobacterales bacterium]|nr:alpha/beta fold hydrolase [Desulfobacterales bacterium]
MTHKFIVNLLVTLILLISFTGSSFAISETDFEERYRNEVMSEYNTGYFGTFVGVDDIEISYVKFESLGDEYKGAIVIQHGDTESYRKYAELVYDLKEFREEGFQIFLMDLRGQGYSERMLSNKYKDYVKKFDDYVTDYSTFIDTIVKADNPPQVFAIAHSLGGCVTFLYMQENPNAFDAAVLSSPMLKPLTAGLSEEDAFAMAETAVILGFGKLYAIGESWTGENIGPKNKLFIKDKFEGNKITTSEVRWTKWNDVLQENDNELDVNGHAFNWIYESLKAARIARDHENAAKIKTPMLIFEAENDLIVDTSVYEGVKNAINSAGGQCEVISFGNESMHEIYVERDVTRDDAVNETISFIRSYIF